MMLNFVEQRKQALQSLESTVYDALIIGGGATGVGCALEASLRGLKVILIEAKDFGSGASSNSTKLIHGGVRYLEKAVKEQSLAQLNLVREALSERKTMLHSVEILTRPLPILIPCKKWHEKWYYYLGLRLYDELAGKRKIGDKARALGTSQIQNLTPIIAEPYQKGGVLFYDGQFEDNAYLFTMLRAANAGGATFINYFPFENWQEPGTAWAKDLLTGKIFKIRSRYTLNCTGFQADVIRKKVQAYCVQKMKPSQGVHVAVSPDIWPLKAGILIPKTKDGRIVFILPWQDIILIGTTENALQAKDGELQVTIEEIEFLISTINPYLARPISKNDILGVSIGARPLLGNENQDTTQSIVRSHEIEDWPTMKWANVMGGKWTTWRKMAEEAVDLLIERLEAPFAPSISSSYSLRDFVPEPYQKVQNIYATHLEKEVLNPENQADSFNELKYWTEATYALTPEDILERRLMLGLRNFRKAKELSSPLLTHLNTLDPFNANWRNKQNDKFMQKLDYYQKILQ
jgi:glycerol-3-phosphate dehydrogenase